MTEAKKTVIVDLYAYEGYSGRRLPEKLGEFLSMFREMIGTVPPEHQNGIRIELSADKSEDGEAYPVISIFYPREETDQELKERLAAEEHRQHTREVQEYREYLKLKARYEHVKPAKWRKTPLTTTEDRSIDPNTPA